MKTSRASAAAKAKPAGKGRGETAPKASRKRTRRSATDAAIASEFAPAVAIALLDKTVQAPGAPPAALDCLAAGVSPADGDDKVRVQLLFANGAVLPVEMSAEAGASLAKGLSDELLEDK